MSAPAFYFTATRELIWAKTLENAVTAYMNKSFPSDVNYVITYLNNSEGGAIVTHEGSELTEVYQDTNVLWDRVGNWGCVTGPHKVSDHRIRKICDWIDMYEDIRVAFSCLYKDDIPYLTATQVQLLYNHVQERPDRKSSLHILNSIIGPPF